MSLYDELYFIIYLTLYQFKLIFPYWIAGVFAGAIISTFSGDKVCCLLNKFNRERYSLCGAFFSALLGAASPVCMYGTIPIIAGLGKKGFPQYLLAAFMVTSILINPNLLVFSFVLGARVALLRLLACIAAGMIAGLLVYVFYRRRPFFRFENFETEDKQSACLPSVKRFFHKFHRTFVITAPYFLAGIIITALFDRYVPRELFTTVFGMNKGMGVLYAASFGVPMYVCGGGTIPIIKAWLDAGMSLGSALAFMITGPATKLTNLGAVKIILGTRNFILYMVYVLVFAVILGWTADLLTAAI